MKPKIAVFHNLPSGGAKRVLFENIKGLQSDFDFYLYDLKGPYDNFLNVKTLAKETSTFEFKEIPLLPKPFGFLNSFCRIIDLFRLNQLHKKIAQEIDKENYSLVFIFADRFTQTPFLLKHLRTKTLYYAHDPYIRSIYDKEIERPIKSFFLKEKIKKIAYFLGEFLYKKILAWQDKKNTKKATKVIICSQYAGLKMKEKYGVDPEVIYPGVDTKIFRPLKNSKDKAVISQGAILYRKGHEFIIRSLSKIEEKYRPRLYILADSGRDDEEAILKNLAKQLEIKLIFYKGITRQEEVVNIYNQALICVCGQISEPFPLAVLEANACGLPVVAVADGGMKESVIDSFNGCLSEREPSNFAEKVKKLLTDENLRKKIGLQARNYIVDNYNWQRCNQKLKTVFKQSVA